MVARRSTLVLATALAALAAAAASRARPSGDDHVLLIGDSIGTGMYWHDDAIAVMQTNLEVTWQIAVCRTVTGVGCPFDGSRPENALDLVDGLADVPEEVVVELGYNDTASTFPSAIRSLVAELVERGAKRVYWLTLREAEAPYPGLNAVLRQAAAETPSLRLIDWNADAADHPEWFQSDGLHLLESGGVAMAHLIHGAVIADIAPLRIASPRRLSLCAGRTGRRLTAAGGTRPYTWRVASGRPPHGVHLLADGRVSSTRPGTGRLAVRVSDADGTTATGVVSVSSSRC